MSLLLSNKKFARLSTFGDISFLPSPVSDQDVPDLSVSSIRSACSLRSSGVGFFAILSEREFLYSPITALSYSSRFLLFLSLSIIVLTSPPSAIHFLALITASFSVISNPPSYSSIPSEDLSFAVSACFMPDNSVVVVSCSLITSCAIVLTSSRKSVSNSFCCSLVSAL